MKLRSSWNIFFSAFLSAAAFNVPYVFGWMILFFLTPLVYGQVRHMYRHDFWDGVLWGILFYMLHLWAFFYMIIERGSGLVRFVIPLALLAYFSSHTGAWFFFVGLLQRWSRSSVWICVSWFIATLLYLEWMRVYGLWILGSPLGYPFASIVLPISHYSNVLLMVSIVGIVVMQAFIIFSSLLSAALLARGRWGWLLFVLVFFVSLLFYHPRPLHQAPDWCTSIVAVTPYSAQGSCARDCADDIRSMLVKYAEDQHISMIIMPESSYPFVLDAETAASWCDVLPSRDTALIVGAQREEKNSLYTTMFFVSDRLIIDYYDKKLLVPCVEYIPTLWQPLQCMKTLFLKGITSLCCGNSQNKRWCLVPGFIVQPCICSDLFFSLNTQNYCDESTLLCIVNDSWFMYAYPKDLMVLFARMHAAVCRQDVIYVSYAHAFFISQDGYLHFLKS